MKIYIVSLIMGLLVGVLYSLINVRSPAPPSWALAGLLGMVLGEGLIPFVKDHFTDNHNQAQVVQQQETSSTTTSSAPGNLTSNANSTTNNTNSNTTNNTNNSENT